jgi:4-alpha-glucanotransferase
MTPPFLEQLASRCGIGLTMTDGHGQTRQVPRETLVAILRALGVAADTDHDAQASLAALEREVWQTVLAPATVANEAAVAVEVTLPAATRSLTWRLALEDGTQRTGGARFADLPLVARDDDLRPGRRKERRRLVLGALPLGYHRLAIEPHDSVTTLIVTPARCHLPDTARRYWGVALQLYLLRSSRNLGIGDFGDLASLAPPLRNRGCDIIGLNPMHAPFPDDPEHASPYSPASRLLLNPLNIDVASLPEVQASHRASALLASEATAAEVARYRAAEMLEYGPIAALKQRVLELAFADWSAAGGDSSRDLAAFRAARGGTFERHCLYFALRAHMLAEGLAPGDWHRWPQPYQDSRGAVVARFARSHADKATFFAWQQWLADRQLATAAEAAGAMSVGLYRDLAVGSDASGAETWAERELVLDGLSIGAPPDALSAGGQDWGLPPPHPQRMRAGAYRNFIELLRANMRHAGALRIDHVMALSRLFVIPHGLPAHEGTYLEYPFDELLGVLALESMRERCVIVGEDLGTVPPGFRERLAAAQMLSYRVVRFENEWGSNRPIRPEHYPPLSVAVFGNHDLATLRGWWDGTDIGLEREYGAPHDEAEARRRREADKEALLALLREQGLVSGASPPPFAELAVAVHRLLGRTKSLLAGAQLDDMLGETQPVNSPSAQRYPSWRRRYSVPLEDLERVPLVERISAALAVERPSEQSPS